MENCVGDSRLREKSSFWLLFIPMMHCDLGSTGRLPPSSCVLLSNKKFLGIIHGLPFTTPGSDLLRVWCRFLLVDFILRTRGGFSNPCERTLTMWVNLAGNTLLVNALFSKSSQFLEDPCERTLKAPLCNQEWNLHAFKCRFCPVLVWICCYNLQQIGIEKIHSMTRIGWGCIMLHING